MKLCVLFVGMVTAILTFSRTAQAGSGRIQFTTADTEIIKGREFTVVCQLTSSDAFLDAEFRIVYDSNVLRFVKGGKKVSGGDGVLKISSTGNTDSSNKKTFSLQFVAKKKGNTTLMVDGDIKVTDEEGTAFSISSNQLLISVVKKKSGDSNIEGNNPPEGGDGAPNQPPDEVVRPEATPAPTPEPTPEPTKKPKTTKKPKKTEAPELTEQQIPQEVTDVNRVKDIPFGIEKKNDTITLKNSYEFEVIDPSKVEEVPAGYIQSNIELDGVTVPAYTMERDLDNNYLLLYLKGPSGKNTWYQYDREEKTLQRYTGDMIKKVNQSAGASGRDSSGSGISVLAFGIIIFLVVIILCMMIAMLKMAMKKRDTF